MGALRNRAVRLFTTMWVVVVLAATPFVGWAQLTEGGAVEEVTSTTASVATADATNASATAAIAEATNATATSTTQKEAAPEFDVKETVLHHLADSYWWHITKLGDKDIYIGLPVIVKSRSGQWSFFNSSKLEHGGEYDGFWISHKGRFSGKIVQATESGEEVRPAIDISFTKNALGLFINCTVLLLVILPLAGWYRKGRMEPAKGFRGAVEMLMVSIEDEIIKPSTGEYYRKYSSYLLTVFFFIFVNNLMGLVPIFPGGANVTGNIAVTMVLALCTFMVVNLSGTREYWKEIFWPDVPTWLKVPAPIMPFIELIGIFTKPFALMIRLFANIMAGHSIILGLTMVIFVTVKMGVAINVGMTTLSVVFSVFMSVVELLVAYIQAYVFTLLSAVFIGMAKVKPHAAHIKKEDSELPNCARD